MAKRERYTERARPHRREVGSSGSEGAPGATPPSAGLSNPAVMIAVGGLGVAIILLIAVMIGREMAGDAPATAADPTAEAIQTLAAAAGEGEVSDTEPESDAEVTGTEPVTDSDEASPIENEGETVQKQSYSAPEDQGLDAESNSYFATIETNKGTIRAELWPGLAPQHVNSFVFLAREGFFDGLTFHRVVPDFVIQGGDPAGTGSGGPGYSVPAEFTDVPHIPGILSMARTNDPNSAGSQFFVVTGEASNLDNQYSVFGYVFEGMDVVYDIQVGDTMTSVTIEEKPASDSVVSPDDVREGNLDDNS